MEAKRDSNNVPNLLVVGNISGLPIVALTADPTTHKLDVEDAATGSDLGTTNAKRDNSGIPVMIALSNANDGVKVALYANNSNSKLLIKST